MNPGPASPFPPDHTYMYIHPRFEFPTQAVSLCIAPPNVLHIRTHPFYIPLCPMVFQYLLISMTSLLDTSPYPRGPISTISTRFYTTQSTRVVSALSRPVPSSQVLSGISPTENPRNSSRSGDRPSFPGSEELKHGAILPFHPQRPLFGSDHRSRHPEFL